MGHILLGAPGIDRFHLVDRLVRELQTRGHRATVLCLDPAEFEFWRAQGLVATLVEGSRTALPHAPIDECAEVDCRRRRQRPGGGALARARARLLPFAPGLLRLFESAAPDLLLLHQRRTGAHALMQFVARECGTRALWTGNGLLPQTMQLDDEGLDGDARAGRRSAWDFRGLPVDQPFLQSVLAAVLGRNTPPALARRAVQVPSLRTRLRAAWQSRRQGLGGLRAAFDCWQQALAPIALQSGGANLPARPFVAVLLQRDDDDRLCLDGGEIPSPADLAHAARAAAWLLERDMPVVAVLPRGGLLVREFGPLRRLQGIQLEHADAAIDACAAASAVITVNDGLAATALLADTPVVHLGRSLYGVPGVATRGALSTLGDDLRRAIDDDQPELRRRFLTWMFAHGHIWCAPEAPDHNGLNGVVLQIERRLARRSAPSTQLHYRAGPAWPLAAESNRSEETGREA